MFINIIIADGFRDSEDSISTVQTLQDYGSSVPFMSVCGLSQDFSTGIMHIMMEGVDILGCGECNINNGDILLYLVANYNIDLTALSIFDFQQKLREIEYLRTNNLSVRKDKQPKCKFYHREFNQVYTTTS